MNAARTRSLRRWCVLNSRSTIFYVFGERASLQPDGSKPHNGVNAEVYTFASQDIQSCVLPGFASYYSRTACLPKYSSPASLRSCSMIGICTTTAGQSREIFAKTPLYSPSIPSWRTMAAAQ